MENKPSIVKKAVNPFRDDFLDRKFPGVRKGEYGYIEKKEEKDE